MATKTTKKTAAKANGKFSAEERAAMRARAKELKAEAEKADLEKACLDAINAMPGPDKAMAKKLHEIVKANAPTLSAKTWYGMPGYATAEGKNVCFFKAASKFNQRYATIGFSDLAKLDDGNMWPTDYAVTKLGPAEEKKIAALLKKALR